MRSCDATTRFNGTTQDPHAMKAADLRKGNHRLVFVQEGRSGAKVKSQLRDLERQRGKLEREGGGNFVAPGIWTGFGDYDAASYGA